MGIPLCKRINIQIMKKIHYLIFALIIAISTISCSSDDDSPNNEPQFSIVGTWKVTQQFINGVQQDIEPICNFKGNVKFVNGGTYVEDIYALNSSNSCVLSETIGGTWEKHGDSYKINVSEGGDLSILPLNFTPTTDSDNFNKFEISHTALGTTTRLVFTKL